MNDKMNEQMNDQMNKLEKNLVSSNLLTQSSVITTIKVKVCSKDYGNQTQINIICLLPGFYGSHFKKLRSAYRYMSQ